MRVLLTPIKEETVSKSGLNLTGATPLKYKKATVSHIGTDVKHVNVGDTVHYDSSPTHETRIEGELYVVALERDIFVVL